MKLQIRSGQVTVATSGTEQPLSSTDKWAVGLSCLAPAANAGVVYLGDSTVTTSNGRAVSAGGSVNFQDLVGADYKSARINLKNVYVDAATNGDKITFVYFEEVL